MKQQGHFNETAVIAYSPDAQTIATGGVDGKIVKAASVIILNSQQGHFTREKFQKNQG